MLRWLKPLAALALSLSLTAAPCKNCEPKPVKAQAQHCQHDCCPKPKTDQPACKWQPADYAASEAKQEHQGQPEFTAIPAEHGLRTDPELALPAPPAATAETPPLYLAVLQLRN